MYKRLCLYFGSAMLGIALALAMTCVFTVTTVTGGSMEPAIERDSIVLINKLAYGLEGQDVPAVGSVIAFKSEVYGEDGEGSILIRRVAGSSGDVVEIKDNIFYLNEKPYQEYMTEAVHMEDMGPVRLGSNEIFVLSDDRRFSMDSRNEAIGVLDSRECIGKVCFE